MPTEVRVWWDEAESVARYWISGEATETAAEEVHEAFLTLASEHEAIDCLADIRELSKAPSSRARKVLAEMAKHPKVGRMAMLGSGTAIRVAARFVLTASGKADDARFFSSEKEALEWL